MDRRPAPRLRAALALAGLLAASGLGGAGGAGGEEVAPDTARRAGTPAVLD